MCGIFLLFKLENISNNDYQTLMKIKSYCETFQDEAKSSSDNETYDSDFISYSDFVNESIGPLVDVIKKRGPDYFNFVKISSKGQISICEKVENFSNLFKIITDDEKLVMMSSVLSLRGVMTDITPQPLFDSKTGNILQYTGEIFSIFESNYDIYKQNDGLILQEILSYFSLDFYSSNNKSNSLYSDYLFDLLSRVESDHAFVYTDLLNQKIILNRDMFGKRSLILIFLKKENLFIITSVLTQSFCKLHPGDVEIIEVPANSLIIFDLISNQKINFFLNNKIPYPHMMRFKNSISFNQNSFSTKELSIPEICESVFCFLNKAVFKRVCNLPQIVKEDSNKCSIAVLFSGGIDSLLLAYLTAINTPNFTQIDLINLAFDRDAPDRNSGLISYYELISLLPDKKISLVLVDKNYEKDVEPLKEDTMSLIYPKNTHMDFNIATALSLATRLEGFKIQPELFKSYMIDFTNNIDISLSKIDDKNPNNNMISKKINNVDYTNFKEKILYKSESKIVLSGLGADEFFGGYARYKSAYLKGGADRLKEEMKKDIDRIWTRNFGRDDRACSHNGIELRFPYFDCDLLSFLSQEDDITKITDFTMPRGEGEKQVLRKICFNLGFKLSHLFEKRAIQFGTKLAKETNLKKYGSNRKANGKAQYK
jgi:asparagine synthetase B (glutamine-hydrolysing)